MILFLIVLIKWSQHVPALADRAWSKYPDGIVKSQGWQAKWVPPRIQNKL